MRGEAATVSIKPSERGWEWSVLSDFYPCENMPFSLDTGAMVTIVLPRDPPVSLGKTWTRWGARRAARRAIRRIEEKRHRKGYDPLPSVEWIGLICNVPFGSKQEAEEVLAAAALKLGAGHRGINHLRIALGLPFGKDYGKEMNQDG